MKYNALRTPSYIIQEGKLRENLEILHNVEEKAGCKILLAQKAFSMYKTYPLISKYLSGTTASGIYEARLSHEEFGENKENHVFEPAYKSNEMKVLADICSHIYFNSISQLECHRKIWEPKVSKGLVKIALRINPEFSTQEGHEIYDPCSTGSRLGIRKCNLPKTLPSGVTGLHFHTLCEQGLQPLIDTFRSVEDNFPEYLETVSWINLGGGHHITKKDYDVNGLIDFIKEIKAKWNLEVYLEPGEAIALDAGTLITTVLDIVDTEDMPTLILDASAACHMPDVIEMPYTPPLFGALEEESDESEESKESEESDVTPNKGKSGVKSYKVRLASRTCLAGDVIGIYCLPEVPSVGDILTFGDMAIYSMVKNNTFNGMALPDIVLEHDSDLEDRFEIVKQFDYLDFKMRLS